MTLIVPLSPQVEAKLRQQAAAEGKDPAGYASKILEQAVDRVSLDELLAPLRRQFAASGIGDDEFISDITNAQAEYREEKQKTR